MNVPVLYMGIPKIPKISVYFQILFANMITASRIILFEKGKSSDFKDWVDAMAEILWDSLHISHLSRCSLEDVISSWTLFHKCLFRVNRNLLCIGLFPLLFYFIVDSTLRLYFYTLFFFPLYFRHYVF